MKYTGIATKMAITILIGVFTGIKLDEWISWEIPVFTLVLTILSSAFSIYIIIKGITK
ncbi:AtpZ/AtpI family protein [Flexithrix dorotheae]|uniref:AtpZ/AtpI family protein n=1 Tax=Flexithrix dorotheae TaxID=70993 RepID=UPI0024819789|nr:AtpZ/AtpI family protein [Flexithrix dorotheae]